MNEQDTVGLDPATATRAALGEEIHRLQRERDEFAAACLIHYERGVEVRARVAELEAQRAAALALCDEAERHAGTARFGYLNEDDVRAALTAAGDTGGTR